MKTKRNYSFKKAASAINGIIAETLTDMVRYQNEAIQAGIDNSRDIEGNPKQAQAGIHPAGYHEAGAQEKTARA